MEQDRPDHNISISGFQTFQAEQDGTESGQHKGGRLAVLIDSSWCNPGHIINIKERICCPDVELLAVRLRSYYCPGSSHVFTVVVYETSTMSVLGPFVLFTSMLTRSNCKEAISPWG